MSIEIIDINTWLGSWPFSYYHEDTAARLSAHLEEEGVATAFVGSPESVFNHDYPEVNRILADRIAAYPRLLPVMTIDPTIGDWSGHLAKYRDEGVAAVRIIPSYHDYAADSPHLIAFLEDVAKARDLVLFVQMRMEDERTHHPRCKVPAFEDGQVAELARKFPDLSIVALCPGFYEAVTLLTSTENVCVDISHVETLRTLASLLSKVPAERVLFGSHSPFLYTRSAAMKLCAPYVPEDAQKAIGSANIRRLLDGIGRPI